MASAPSASAAAVRSRAVGLRRAFSLVELLVVIGVVSMLMAIAAPAIRAAREAAQQVRCAAQLHQLGIALSMYANEHQGTLPGWSGWHVYPDGSSPEDAPGLGWTEQLQRYYARPDSPAYSCPSFPAKFTNYFITGRWSGQNGRHTMKLSEIKMSSRFVVSGEATHPEFYPPPYGHSIRTTNDCDRDDAIVPCVAFPEDGGFLMHRAGINVMFDDWHVQAFRRFDPSSMTYHPAKMVRWQDVVAEKPVGGPKPP